MIVCVEFISTVMSWLLNFLKVFWSYDRNSVNAAKAIGRKVQLIKISLQCKTMKVMLNSFLIAILFAKTLSYLRTFIDPDIQISLAWTGQPVKTELAARSCARTSPLLAVSGLRAVTGPLWLSEPVAPCSLSCQHIFLTNKWTFDTVCPEHRYLWEQANRLRGLCDCFGFFLLWSDTHGTAP